MIKQLTIFFALLLSFTLSAQKATDEIEELLKKEK